MATNISAESALNSYALFNATDIKSYIINQLSNSNNDVFSGCSYLGSNMNALLDVISVLTQQILFHFSVNASEANFATANLYESMSKLVSILNYKTVGKQTSMLPVRFNINVASFKAEKPEAKQLTIPRFTRVSYNSDYYLKNEIIIPLDDNTADNLYVDSVLFEGSLQEVGDFIALGDEFETFLLEDRRIKTSSSFISDNFFVVYIDEDGDGQWREYTETLSLFSNDGEARVFERKFNEDLNYEFKFGNGVNGKKLKQGSKVAIFYIMSSGEVAIIGDGVVKNVKPNEYSSSLWSAIIASNYTTIDTDSFALQNITVSNIGGSTDISYPESVESIRANAPKIFASQNRLFTLADYKTFIQKNYSSYIKDTYFCTNDEYTRDFLKYYYNLGLDRPQEDSRLNISQVEFMTSTNFNNVYCFAVPKVNTIINGTIPNYLNTTLKQEVVNGIADYKGLTHNLVMLDPIYRAICFGSYMEDEAWNPNQLQNRLILVRNRLTKYSYSFIKDYAVTVIKNFFNSLRLGDDVDMAQLSKDISAIPGIKRFLMRNVDGGEETKLTLYYWNPLYSNEDNATTQQTIINEPFVYPYFYNLENVGDLITIEDE